nr:MAG TPA: hypothetical protein [Caudoviricetes sp.]
MWKTTTFLLNKKRPSSPIIYLTVLSCTENGVQSHQSGTN